MKNNGCFVPLENLKQHYTYIACEWFMNSSSRFRENVIRYPDRLEKLAGDWWGNTTYFGFYMKNPYEIHI